jgi:hypothetical protein
MTDPEDVASIVVFLVSIVGCNPSGQSFGIDGNMELL